MTPQARQKEEIMILPVNLGADSYDIIIEKGSLRKIGEYLNLNRKVFIVTDDGVPKEYAEAVSNSCKEPHIYTIEHGEKSKSLQSFEKILVAMLRAGFSRKDCVVAVGGGVVGDLAGFVASAYMRGVDFYNIPTTVLAQVDSSIGGKTAVNLDGIKNIVGAFYQPKRVVIDVDVLKTLPPRQISEGLAESVKMSLTSDKELFELIEKSDIKENIETIIEKSLRIKKAVVEEDEKEQGLRKILNFGHTIGHGIESASGGKLYHGEAVALGMIPLVSDEVRNRLIPVLKKLNLPTGYEADREKVFEAVIHDKKASNGKVSLIRVEKIGSFVIEETDISDLKKLI